MSRARQHRSPIMAAIHETAEDLNAVGLMAKRTMRKFDAACLTPVRPLSASSQCAGKAGAAGAVGGTPRSRIRLAE